VAARNCGSVDFIYQIQQVLLDEKFLPLYTYNNIRVVFLLCPSFTNPAEHKNCIPTECSKPNRYISDVLSPPFTGCIIDTHQGSSFSKVREKNHQVPVGSADESCELLELNPKYPLQWKVEQYMMIEQTRGILGI
jgi:hypothetical protein